jgi:hypothetical protein
MMILSFFFRDRTNMRDSFQGASVQPNSSFASGGQLDIPRPAAQQI